MLLKEKVLPILKEIVLPTVVRQEAEIGGFVFMQALPRHADLIANLEEQVYANDEEQELRIGRTQLAEYLKRDWKYAQVGRPTSFIAYKNERPVGFMFLQNYPGTNVMQIGDFATVPQSEGEHIPFSTSILTLQMIKYVLSQGLEQNISFTMNARDKTTFNLLQKPTVQKFLAQQGYAVSETKPVETEYNEGFHYVRISPLVG